MLIEVTEAAAILVSLRSSVGQARARWRGDRPPMLESYHVEWTIDLDAEWGGIMEAASLASPEIRMDGDSVVFRGRLRLLPEDAADLDVGGTLIMLDLATPVPEETDGAWVELRAPSLAVEIYPYDL